MNKILPLVAVAGMLSLAGCGGGDGNGNSNPPPGSAGSTFSGTFVPFESIGGVRIGDTYEAVQAAHGEPDMMVEPQLPDSPIEGVVYGREGVPWSIQLGFLDADGSGQLSGADTVEWIDGSDVDMQGFFKFAGVGTGNTEAEIATVLGRPYERNTNQYDPDLSYFNYYTGGFSKGMTLNFEGGVCYDILIY
jgi:hypothetical protein